MSLEIIYPVTADQLKNYLPHRDPMCWVDQVLESHSSGYGKSETVIKNHTLMMDSLDKIWAVTLIELMAQTYGYIKAIELKKDPKTVHRYIALATLASIDEFEVYTEYMPGLNDLVQTQVTTLTDMHPLYIIEGQVYNQNKILSRAKLKCYALLDNET